MNHDVTEDNQNKVLMFGFISYFLILIRLVPLDVVVNCEVAKIAMTYFITNDAEMMSMDPVPGSKAINGCVVHSTSLVEELGCIEHIFSDKTGTLTKN